MTGKESEDKIQMITKLLEKGGTMLANHHDCGAPMFRYQGKVVCPVCDYQEKKQKQPEELEKQTKKTMNRKSGKASKTSDLPGFQGVHLNQHYKSQISSPIKFETLQQALKLKQNWEG